MECFERGLITKEDTDGIELKFGNHQAMVELVRKMAFREGFGNVLAEGSLRAAQQIGKGSHRLTMQIKGSELAGFDPRGAMAMGLGFATYKIPSTLDIPEIEVILVEQPVASGPFGAKSVGESGMILVAPSIANAIYNAVGVRMTELPMTPERVLKALKAKSL
jgi:aldehyde:ferredoxin oxidoreductase